MPQFIEIHLDDRIMRTTDAAPRPRQTPIRTLERTGGEIYVQGVENGRAFSFVVDEISGEIGFHNPASKAELSWPAQLSASSYEIARSTEPGVAAGIRRLAVIDLVGGTQPMASEDGAVRVVTLNRPEKINAMTVTMRKALIEVFGEADRDDDVRGIAGAQGQILLGDIVPSFVVVPKGILDDVG